jgi:superfamily II DNA/RNA helicase
MLDMGFIPDIEEICTKLPKERQTLLFSATMPPVIKKLADKFLNDPKRVEVARPATTNTNITQFLIETTTMKKRETLRALLDAEDVQTGIVFCNRKTTVRELNKSLQRHGIRSAEIHGDMDQPARLAELERFKKGDVNILVASDVAARGLDIKGVSHVYNFDAPWHPDDYVHRIGRTGRAGATGTAYTLVTKEDAENVANIEKLTGQKIERVKLRNAPAPSEEEEPAEAPRGRRRKGDEDKARKPRARKEEPRREEARREEPVRETRARDEQPRRDRDRNRRRDERDDGPDEGWNGPIPDFLNYTLAE